MHTEKYNNHTKLVSSLTRTAAGGFTTSLTLVFRGVVGGHATGWTSVMAVALQWLVHLFGSMMAVPLRAAKLASFLLGRKSPREGNHRNKRWDTIPARHCFQFLHW